MEGPAMPTPYIPPSAATSPPANPGPVHSQKDSEGVHGDPTSCADPKGGSSYWNDRNPLLSASKIPFSGVEFYGLQSLITKREKKGKYASLILPRHLSETGAASVAAAWVGRAGAREGQQLRRQLRPLLPLPESPPRSGAHLGSLSLSPIPASRSDQQPRGAAPRQPASLPLSPARAPQP